MSTLREEIYYRLPKVVSNLALALIFWVARYIVLVTLNAVNPEMVFLLQMGLLIVAGIFVVRALFNTLTVFDKLTGSFLVHLGIKDGLSRQRVFKDIMCIVAVLLVAAALLPLLSILPDIEPVLQQVTTYGALGVMMLFVYDIGRTFYRLTEQKANLVANRLVNSVSEDENIDGK
ncbi:MAG: hypothetical protein WC325_05475 [Candidatus Bathyarchaeia archaeon]